MTKGIVLIAFGKKGYAFAAWNMAFSLKYYNPDIKITVLHDNKFMQHLLDQKPESELNVFDEFIELPDEILFSDGGYDPCLTKISMYDYLPYDYNLYLDADGCALQDISKGLDEMIKAGGYYYTHIFDHWTIQQGNDNQNMVWAWPTEIWEHYNLSSDAKLPSTNSSIQFIKKAPEAEKFFYTLKENYKNKIPLERLRLKWGGGQPDELYINVTLAQLGWGKAPNDYIFFGNHHSSESLETIQKNYLILSIFGGRGFTRLMYVEWMDRELLKMTREKGTHHFITEYLIRDKHANQVNARHSSAPLSLGFELKKADIPILETKLIPVKTFIKEYPLVNRSLKVINYLNPSVINFDGKRIMVYRMEMLPWCTYTKLGICLLDESLNPIEGTSKLLNLHSDLKGFQKGYHVEDARLFVFKDELYLSYTDGYQMAQAKIDPETLEATESFYIEKPFAGRTEKNWTFFQNENDLLSVYSIKPHVVFKMDGSNHSVVANFKWESSWKFGELRGGTSPVEYREHYLSFFHSSSDAGQGRQYFMGAYLFEKTAPFKVVAISKAPIIAGEIVPFEIPRLSNKIFVVFPGGVIRNEKSFTVMFGYNDYQCRAVEVTDEYLISNLITT